MNKKTLILFIIFIFVFCDVASGCTGITYSDDDKVLIGKNQDWWDPNSYIHFIPGNNERYGCVFFENNAFNKFGDKWIGRYNGMNEKGLYYGIFSNFPSKLPIKSFYKKIFFPIINSEFEKYCLQTCSNVDQVVEFYNNYNLYFMYGYQTFFVDKSGDSIIIEGDDIIYKNGDFQVVTNFLQSVKGSNPDDAPCWRYKHAYSMIENMTDFSVDFFSEILDVTHLESKDYATKTSVIFNLTSGLFWVYNHHNFSKNLVFNLSEKLSYGEDIEYCVPELFETEINNPPDLPELMIINSNFFSGYINFSINTNDIDNDDIYYWIDWGVAYKENTCIGHYKSNEIAYVEFIFPLLISKIRVKAQDVYGAESEWETLEVSMPKNKAIHPFLLFLERLIERFPILEQILQPIYDKLTGL